MSMTDHPLRDTAEHPLSSFWVHRQVPWLHFFSQDRTRTAVSLLFVSAFIVGVSLKLLFGAFITIGHDDYRIKHNQPNVQLNTLQKNLLERGGSLAYTPEQVTGPACSISHP